MKPVRCPICGRRIFDSFLQPSVRRLDRSVLVDVDFVIKCPKCNNNLGVNIKTA